jgi:hypothetical protein
MNQWLSGGAGQITGAGRNVTLTDIIPNLANRSVTVWAHTNPGGMPGYNVVAQAICRPNPPPPNYGLVTAASPLNGANHKTVQAICPNGTRLLGTGAELQQGFGRAFYRSVEPDGGLTMNTVRADEAFALGNWRAIAYAICGTPPGVAPVRLAAASAFNPVNVKSIATGVCPGGRHTTGVGGHADPAANIAGFVFIDGIMANAAQDQATAGALEGVNPGAVPWDETAYNICW